jgi:hypothetical protein
MTDYQPLIARAVEGLGKSTGEARRGLYERARTALVTQLRNVDPPLSESEITRERLSLEEAIRKVEADAARKSRMDARVETRPTTRFEPRPLKPISRPAPAAPPPEPAAPPPPSPPPPASPPPVAELLRSSRAEPRQDEPEQQQDFNEPDPAPEPPRPAPATARDRLLGARTSPSLSKDGLKGFRNVVSETNGLGSASARAAQTARDTRDTYEPQPRRLQRADDLDTPSSYGHTEPEFNLDDYGGHDSSPPESLEHSFELDETQNFPPQPRERAPRPPGPDDEYEQSPSWRPNLGTSVAGGFIKVAVVACIIGIVVALIYWQIPHLKQLAAQWTSHSSGQTPPAPQQPATPKFDGRVPQDQGQAQPPGNAPAANQTAPAVAQHALLYEADPANPQGQGTRFVGSVIWRTETVSPGPGLAPELVVRATIEIPDRRMTVTWTLRRNTDKNLPASHTIEIVFNLPADFPSGGVANVPGVMMKQAEQARGTPLAGTSVKVTNGYFLIGLTADDTNKQRNLQLLKDQEWFDIPIVYSNDNRAILAVEKGQPGDRAFADAFAAWAK